MDSRTAPTFSAQLREWRIATAWCLKTSPAGKTWTFFQIVITIISIVLYIYTTYQAETSNLVMFENYICLGFAVDFFLQWLAAANWVLYPFGLMAIGDLITLIPYLLDYLATSGLIMDLRALRIVRIIRIFRVTKLLRLATFSKNDMMTRALLKPVVSAIVFLIFSAAILLIAEQDFFEEQMGVTRAEANKEGLIVDKSSPSFGNMIYFLVVSVSSVGYGDIIMVTPWGRVILIILIAIVIVCLPIVVASIAEVYSSRSRFRITFQPPRHLKHVILIGEFGSDSGGLLSEFLYEFYSDHRKAHVTASGSASAAAAAPSAPGGAPGDGIAPQLPHRRLFIDAACTRDWVANGVTSDSPIVILGEHEPDERLQRVLLDSHYADKVHFALGSPYVAADLERVSTSAAATVFVLVSHSTEQSAQSHAALSLVLLSLRSIVPEVPVHLCGHSPSSLLFINSLEGGVKPIIDVEVRATLLALNTLAPGAGTLAINLLRSPATPRNLVSINVPGISLDPWELEYALGTHARLHIVEVPFSVVKQTFGQAVDFFYAGSSGKLFLIGVIEMEVGRNSREGEKRLARLRRALAADVLLTSDAVHVNSLLSPIATAPVSGQVLLNPSHGFELLEGQQLIFLARDEGAMSLFNFGAGPTAGAPSPVHNSTGGIGIGGGTTAAATALDAILVQPPTPPRARHVNFGLLRLEHVPTPEWRPWQPASVFRQDLGVRYMSRLTPGETHSIIDSLYVKKPDQLDGHVIILCSPRDAALAVRPFRIASAIRKGGFSKPLEKGTAHHILRAQSPAAGESDGGEKQLLLLMNCAPSKLPLQLALWLLSAGNVLIYDVHDSVDTEVLQQVHVSCAERFVLFTRARASGVGAADFGVEDGSLAVNQYRSLRQHLQYFKLRPSFSIVSNVRNVSDFSPYEIAFTSLKKLRPDAIITSPKRVVPRGASPYRAPEKSAAHGSAYSSMLSAISKRRNLIKTDRPFMWEYFSPLFVSGQAVPSETIQSLIVRDFFEPLHFQVIAALAHPWMSRVVQQRATVGAGAAGAGARGDPPSPADDDEWGGSSLAFERVPTDFHEDVFGSLFARMLSDGAIVLGLLRAKAALSRECAAPADYVVTAPSADLKLFAPPTPAQGVGDGADYMYVLR